MAPSKDGTPQRTERASSRFACAKWRLGVHPQRGIRLPQDIADRLSVWIDDFKHCGRFGRRFSEKVHATQARRRILVDHVKVLAQLWKAVGAAKQMGDALPAAGIQEPMGVFQFRFADLDLATRIEQDSRACSITGNWFLYTLKSRSSQGSTSCPVR